MTNNRIKYVFFISILNFDLCSKQPTNNENVMRVCVCVLNFPFAATAAAAATTTKMTKKRIVHRKSMNSVRGDDIKMYIFLY